MDEAFIKALLEKLRPTREWLARRGSAFWLLLLVGFILAYYGSYYRHDLRFRDEGGTIALNAQRLLQGERPLRDVVLGYNVMWYYPVVGLFHLFGVNFTLMRVYFFALSGLAALLGFCTVSRAGGQRGIAFLVSVLCVMVPGMIFKNYIPLLVIANSSLLMFTALSAPGSRASYLRVAGGGLLLGLTFLIRIDLGLFFTVLWMGLHVLRLADRGVLLRQRLVATALGIVLTIGLAALVHLPVLADARKRGFEEPFALQYRGWTTMIEREVRIRLGLPVPKINARRNTGVTAEIAPTSRDREVLKRHAWADFLDPQKTEKRLLIILTYLPVAVLSVLLGWTLLALFRGWRSSDPEAFRNPLGALVLIGGALTAFPQFFFFRPDAPHLSEFSPGYWTGACGAALLLGAHRGSWLDQRRLPARLLLGLLVLHSFLYLQCMMPDRWTGTIAARALRSERFTAENGVDAYVSEADLPVLKTIAQVIREHSTPQDYLVAYPYHPMINLMTNRRTYEKDIYVDNATRTRNWDAQAIARFEKFRPAVIVLSDWAVNGHEASRFSVWAAPTKAWVQANYLLKGTFRIDVDAFEIYLRPPASAPL